MGFNKMDWNIFFGKKKKGNDLKPLKPYFKDLNGCEENTGSFFFFFFFIISIRMIILEVLGLGAAAGKMQNLN